MRTNLSDQFTPAERRATGAKIVERNTFQFTRPTDGAVITRLHRTDIVERFRDGSEVLNSGGWKTLTTKDRINSHSRFRITQRLGVWTVSDPRDFSVEPVPFRDGMFLPRDFTGGGRAAAEQQGKADAALDAQIGKFVKLIPMQGDLPQPGPGDCWFCAMQTTGGQSLGDATENTDHLREHIAEGYMHGSLILNALAWRGYQAPGVIFAHGDRAQLRRTVKAYLRAKLGLAR